MTNPTPNPLLFRFEDARPLPDDAPKTVRRIYEIIMEAERRGDWTRHAVTGSVKIDPGPHPVPEWPRAPNRAPRGTDPARAERNMREDIARARPELDRLEAVLSCYGGEAVTVRRYALSATTHPFDPAAAILGFMRAAGKGRFWVHGEEFMKDISGAWRPARDITPAI